MLSTIIVATLLSGVAVLAADPFAVALKASDQWYGIDGNWSTVRFVVGSPPVSVDVLVSTSISEFWIVDAGGCLPNEPLCNSARGETFKPLKSNTWIPLGTWNLGAEYLGYPNDNGRYGLDTVVMYSTISQGGISMDNVITATVNTTNIYTGFFGLGIVQGSFDNKIAESPLTQAVKTYGWIPSYSYGYTAGAYYMGKSGTVVSATLGGFDQSRFIPHNVDFSLGVEDNAPRAMVRHISVSVPEGKEAPDHWGSNTKVLSSMNTSFDAQIDSGTPYLWLPDAVCDQFAEAFNLTYNSTFDLYTLTNDQFATFRKGDSYTFSFTFTSFDNHDDFGHPLQVPGVVNITITAGAFAQTLRYPFQSETIKYGEPSVPYFPLRRTHNATNTFIIGRTFLQEAYLITEYDLGTFSLHQALFPDDAIKDANLTKILQPDNSPFPPPLSRGGKTDGLTTTQMAGIGAGVVVVALVLLLGLCFYRRRRKAKRKASADEDGKDGASSIAPDTPQTPVSRIFSKIIRRKKSKKPGVREASGSSSQPVEVAADSNHEVYELSAPIGPVELDAGHDDHSINGDTELGSESTQNLTAYEISRRKLERQLQGPVPAYTPSATPADHSTGEKSMQDVSPIATYRPSDSGSPASSPTTYVNSNSLPDSLPSPMTPRGDWFGRITDLPSPMTVAPPFPSPIFTGSHSGPGTMPPVSPTFDPSSISRSNSSNATSPNSLTGPLVPPSPIYQRTPIDPSRVICLGPLPENVSLPDHNSLPRLPSPDRRSIPMPGMHAEAHHSTDTLGSNFTEVEEQRIVEELTRQASMSQPPTPGPNSTQSHMLETSRSQERIDPGSELIHVPQLADRRYSWEDER